VSERRFTVVIPTRDRSDTLVSAIESVLSQDYPNFSVLVSDNASVDDTEKLVSSVRDSRLHYVNTGRRLSMSHNWEFALAHVNEGWVTVIGDDDALLPGALGRVDAIATATATLAVRANGCSYEWPALRASEYGSLTVELGRGYSRVDSRSALTSVLSGQLSYTRLPMLYNGGFVDTALITAAKKVSGELFRSMIPDVYSSMVFSLLTEDYIYSLEPFAVNGASHHSGGTAEYGKPHVARKYNPAEKFWSEPNIPFHEDLPLSPDGKPVRCIQALVYESYLQAAPFHGQKQLSVLPHEQLEVILGNPGPYAAEVHAWAKDFAALHGLDYQAISRRAASRHRRQAGVLSKCRRVLDSLARSYQIVGNQALPLRNVREAAVEAGLLVSSPPSGSARAINGMRRIQQRFLS
jgi:glycosyltransferase involved in cell wall biosynthesis